MAKKVSTLDPLQIWADSGILTSTRMLYLGGEIDQEKVDAVIKGILALESLDSSRSITLILSSEGGAFYPALALYDALRATSCPTVCKVLGHCLSSAVVVLQGADVRLLGEHTRLMVHDGTEGNESIHARNFESWGDQCKLDRHTMYRIFATRSSYDVSKWQRLCTIDKFMTPSEAIDAGLADSVIKKYMHAPDKTITSLGQEEVNCG